MSARPQRRATAACARVPVAVALLLLALVAACHKSSAPPAPKAECQTRADCQGGIEGGLLCVSGKCQGCARSRDCRLTEACDPVQRRCTLRPCFGDQCTAHDQCPLGNFCVQGLCLDPQAKTPACPVVLCGSLRDCNPGQRCNGRTFVCEQDLGCAQDALPAADGGSADAGTLSACAPGTSCNPASGACEPGCTDQTAAQVCGPVVPCKQGRCVQCAADADCGPGLTCDVAAGACRGQGACAQSRDCAVPLVCDKPTGTCATSRPPCTSNETCAADERCESKTGRCVPGACLPDRFAPNGTQATAAKLAPGSVPGLTLCGREADWFVLQLKSGDRVQVVSDADPLGSFDLSLLSPAGNVLDEAPLALLATVGSDGPYYLVARSNDASASYDLRITVKGGQGCDHNPPGSFPQPSLAAPLGPGPHYDLSACPGEETWFAVRQTGGGLSAQASLDPAQGGAIGLALFDSDGATALAHDESGGPAPAVSAASASGGTFFLRVRGLTPVASARFDLVVRSLAP